MYNINDFEILIKSDLSAEKVYDHVIKINPIVTKQKYSNAFDKIILSSIRYFSRNWFYQKNDEESIQNAQLAKNILINLNLRKDKGIDMLVLLGYPILMSKNIR